MAMELRKAEPDEAERCYQCIEDARDYHRSLGFEQWRPDYPTRQTILAVSYTHLDVYKRQAISIRYNQF